MADKESSIRAKLDASGFLGGVKTMDAATKKFGRDAGKAIKEGFGEGLKEAKHSLAETGREMKGLLKVAVGIGGAFSLEEGVRSAFELKSQMGGIADKLSDMTGKVVRWQDVQENLLAVANRTKTPIESIGEQYDKILQQTGDKNFTDKAIESVAKFAKAEKVSLESASEAASIFKEKFHASAEQVPQMLADMLSASRKGIASFDEMTPRMSQLAAVAKQAGLEGAAGMRFLLGAIEATDDDMGGFEEQAAAISTVLQKLSPKGSADELKKIGKALDPGAPKKFSKSLLESTSSIEVMQKILAKKGGVEALRQAMGVKNVNAQIALRILTDPFTKATEEVVKNTHASEAEKKAATMRGVDAFNKFVEGFGRGDITAEAVMNRFGQKANSAEANMTVALNKFKASFADPQFLNALNKMSADLPKLADMVAKVVGFAVKNPGKAAALGIGAKVGGAVLGGVGASLIKKLVFGGGAAAAGGALAGAGTAAAGAGTMAEATAAVAGVSAAAKALAGLGGAATATGGATAGGGMLATAGGVVAGSAALTGALVAAMAGGALATGYNATKLYKENSNNEGIWEGLKNALKTSFMGPSSPTSGADYDALYPEKLVEATDTAADQIIKHGTVSEDASVALKKVSTEANKVVASFRAMTDAADSASGSGGLSTPTSPSRGPVRLPTPGAGSSPVPFNR